MSEQKHFPINPLGMTVIVRPVSQQKITAGGILIPESSAEKPVFGIVVAISGRVQEPDLFVDTCVLHGKYSGTEIEVQGSKYLLLRAEEIIGVIIDRELGESLLRG